jgi:hypothetical protein
MPQEATPAAGDRPAPTDTPDRDSVIAQLEALVDDAPAPKPKVEEPKPDPEADPKPDEDEPAAERTDEEKAAAEKAEAEKAEAEAKKKAEEEAAVKVDPKVAKGLEAVHRAEKRSREAIAKERAALERDKASVAEQVKAVEEFASLKTRVKTDPIGVLEALGVTDDEMEHLARQAYYRSPAAKKNPEHARRADEERARREETSVAKKALERVEELEKRLAAQAEQAEAERKIGHYIGRVTSAAGEDTPLIKTMIGKNPGKAQRLLFETAQRLADEAGVAPEPADVLRAAEEARRLDLEEMGIDIKAIARPTAPAKKDTPAAGERRAAKSLSNDLGTPTPPRNAPKSREEEIEETRRALEEGRLE